jgi:hypothetical protein
MFQLESGEVVELNLTNEVRRLLRNLERSEKRYEGVHPARYVPDYSELLRVVACANACMERTGVAAAQHKKSTKKR